MKIYYFDFNIICPIIIFININIHFIFYNIYHIYHLPLSLRISYSDQPYRLDLKIRCVLSKYFISGDSDLDALFC